MDGAAKGCADIERVISMVQYIVKRNGEKVSFDAKKIRNAIFKANIRIAAERMSDADLDGLTGEVIAAFEDAKDIPTVEQSQGGGEERERGGRGGTQEKKKRHGGRGGGGRWRT